ncbi:MAG: galactose mutarotase [Woeseiaceae bacterium]|nr:galactose mutarotase [Woeseiaceae bacterium]
MTQQSSNSLAERVLRNAHGDCVTLLNYGARLTGIELQLPEGPRNVICGYKDNMGYLTDPYFMGVIAGRTCNRIAGARFKLDGIDYPLDANEGNNHLHGGANGFHSRYWSIDEAAPEDTVRFLLESADGDQGYPGALEASVTYSWTNERELVIHVEAETDRPTHVNMTNHAYFNLAAGDDDVLGHRLHVASQQILQIDEELLPTGDFLDITDSELDLRRSVALRDVIESQYPLVVRTGGIDFNYILGESGVHAELESPYGDLCLRMITTCPGLQVYGGQKLGLPFAPYRGMCLEPQHFPDSPNQSNFPSTLLIPGERYSQTTSYHFIADRWQLLT